MKLKKLLPVLFAVLILMPIIGVGVVFYTTYNQQQAEKRATEERAEMEARRWEEIRAERAAKAKAKERETAPASAPQFNPELKQAE